MMSREDRIVRKAKKKVGKLRRNALGSFAVDERLLIDLHVVQDAWFIKNKALSRAKRGVIIRAEEVEDLIAIGNRHLARVGKTEECIKAYGEFFYWTGIAITGGNQMNSALVWNNKLLRVVENPEFHPYFAVDIWDEMLISDFIENDIDAELAAAMVVGK